MSDPALSRPPFIPEGTFRCCLCFNVFPENEAWEGELYGEYARWNVCIPCETHELMEITFRVMAGKMT